MATAETRTKPKGIPRGKFATPPVKLACLACRTARIRCDGKEPCTSCSNKGRECTFPAQSRRGGPRVHKNKKASPKSDLESGFKTGGIRGMTPHIDNFFEQSTMINPGAGLKILDDDLADPDNLFDSIFSPTLAPAVPAQDVLHQAPQRRAEIREYGSMPDLLNGYYTWLHPFFPILPPPVSLPVLDRPIGWSPGSPYTGIAYELSPLGLAISAILCLVPLPDVPNPQLEENVAIRRCHAQLLAKRTMDSIENDSDIPDSAISPAKALLHEPSSLPRQPFHPSVPIELESTIALCLLSVYEYAQRGNLKKMRDRAGQALVTAMDQSLHCRDPDDGNFTEARRRAWWMTYVCVCQASIVSCTPPTISVNDPRFTTPFPTLESDCEAWPFFIQSQQAILSATQFVRQLNQSMEMRTEIHLVSDRMQELHGIIDNLISQTEQWPETSAPVAPVDHTEHVVALSLKSMSKIKLNSARIKVHRFCAFSDIPVFSERHCDLKKAAPVSVDLYEQGSTAVPSCYSNSVPALCSTTSSVASTSGSSVSHSPTPSMSSIADGPAFSFPFTSHDSSRICLKSALNIARAFTSLPFPCPLDTSPDGSITQTWMQTPRTMPAFACCAMQSAYALLNLHHRAFVMVGNTPDDRPVSNLLAQCENGLQSILIALENFSISFEALSGMRDQIRVAITCLSAPAW